MNDEPMSERHEIRWRRLDHVAHESATLARHDDGWELAGHVRGEEASAGPYALHYEVRTDRSWVTRSALVEGTLGTVAVETVLVRGEDGGWTRDGVAVPEVAGSLDVDLGFSPATNTLPIRRLALAVGESADVRAAWLRFPAFTFEPLDQKYTREAAGRYRYESAGGRFQAELNVNPAGLVVRYDRYWIADP